MVNSTSTIKTLNSSKKFCSYSDRIVFAVVCKMRVEK